MSIFQPAYLEVIAKPCYFEDATVNGIIDEDGALMTFIVGEKWHPVIDLANGKILDWPKGDVAYIHYKVCDEGEYWLLDANKNRIAKYKSPYVPDDFLSHGDCGYGDYIILDVKEDGRINGYIAPSVIEDEWEAL